MAASPRLPRLSVPLVPFTAALIATLVALGCLAMPDATLAAVATKSGLAGLISAAAPPFGVTARASLALFAGGSVAALVWLGLRRIVGDLEIELFGTPNPPGQRLRREDVHPDAPAKKPLRASRELDAERPAQVGKEIDLPAITADRVVVHKVPADLDTPLAAVDPGSLRVVPLPFEPGPPALYRPSERIETFELPPREGPDAQGHTLAALLDRIERGAARFAAPRPPAQPEAVETTLAHLRRLTTQVG